MSSSDSGSEQSEDGASAFVDSASSSGRNKRKDAPDTTAEAGGDENEDANQAKRQRRTAGSDDEGSENSTSLSEIDSDGDTPLQELVNSNVRLNSGATAGKGSRMVSSKVAPPSKAPSTKAPSTKAPSSKAGASTRTVPEHQPSSPHAELHHPPENDDPSATKPLDDKQLQDAIAVQVKLEEGLEEAVAPSDPRPVEDIVKGPTLVDDSIVHEVKPREKPAQLEERLGVIRFVPVTSSLPSLTTSIVLTGLKNIFQRQLPKMPREYITRLVFDRNHWSVAIVKKGYQVVGGITYRPFEQRTFGEIVFCAITGTEQIRGYGSHLMNHVKDWVQSAHPGIKHFLTYADNYAFGYFKKQGFTKEVTLPRHLWAGYIKDYEGATIMQCTMLPKIKYLEVGTLLLKQKQLILQKIREHSNSHVVHSGRALFGDRTRVDPSEVQALREIGWSPEMDALTRRPERGPQHAIMRRLLTDLQNHPASWAFARPVNPDEVPEYYNTVKTPMDLETMENKLNAGKYDMGPREDGTARTPREGLESFLEDTDLIWHNCRLFNAESSNYTKNANKLERFLKERVRAYTEDS